MIKKWEEALVVVIDRASLSLVKGQKNGASSEN